MTHLRRIWPYVVRYRGMWLWGLVCAACGAAMSSLVPYVLRLAVDAIQAGNLSRQLLLNYGGLIILLAIIDGIFKFGQRILIGGASHRVDFDLRSALFNRFMLLDQRFYSQMHTGDLMARATNDLSAVRQFLGPGVSSTSTAVLTLLAAAVLMFAVNVQLTLVVLLLLPLVTFVFMLVGQRMRRIFTSVQDQFGDLSTRAQENFSGIRTIKAYVQEDAEIDAFAVANDRYRRLNLRYVLLSGILWPSMALILGIVAALVLLLGGRFVAQGQISLGEFVQFNAYLGLLAWPMIALGWTVNLYQQAVASLERLNEVLQRQPTIVSPVDAPDMPPIRGEVEFRNVGIRFAPGAQPHSDAVPAGNGSQLALAGQERDGWMLRHISFRVPAGTSLAIVGATGVGKTTLINLLGRVRDPDEGQVLIDGVDARQLPLAALRQAIGYVPQETFLFSVSLRENVTFGMAGDNDGPDVAERTTNAVAVSHLSNDLPQFPDGLDTLVGERGVTLSGGQKQRVAIARAVLRDPTILILDDALSSVDTHTAATILAKLRTEMQERTSIIIAQRIATVKDADHAIVLHDGGIVEQGTHRMLLHSEGRYAAMYRRELLEAELDDS